MPRTFLRISLVMLVAFVLVYQLPQSYVVDLGSREADLFLDNFHDIERGYRWTNARSAVYWPGVGGNQTWTIGVRLSGSRPGGVPAPQVTLRANGQPIAQFAAASAERDYEFQAAPGQLGWGGDLVVEIDSDTFTPPADPRELGVRVFRVWAAPAGGWQLPAANVFIFVLGIVGAALWIPGSVALGASPNLGGISVPSGTERGRRMLAPTVISLSIALIAIAALAVNRVAVAWWLGIIFLIVSGVAVLLALIAWLVQPEAIGALRWHRLLVILGVAAGLRLMLDLGRGYEGDVAIYMALAWKSVTYGIHSAYLNVSDVPPPNTPPFLLYPFWLMGWLYQRFFSPLFPPTWLADPPVLRFMLRLPSLAADLLVAALIYRVLDGRRRMADGEQPLSRLATASCPTAAAIYLFNPAVIFDSAYWGQTQAIHSLWMLLAMVALSKRLSAVSGAALALAVLTKPQSLAIAPLIVAGVWLNREDGRVRIAWHSGVRCALGFLLTWFIGVLPFVVTGNLAGPFAQLTQTAAYHPYISVNAHNFWWFVTGGQGWQPDAQPLLGTPISYRVAGLALFGAAMLVALGVWWRSWRAAHDEPHILFTLAAYQSFAFFMLLTQIHEDHLLPIFALLVLSCALRRTGWWPYGALALTATANMALHDPVIVQALGVPGDDIYGGPVLALPRWINAVVQTALFACISVRLVRDSWRNKKSG